MTPTNTTHFEGPFLLDMLEKARNNEHSVNDGASASEVFTASLDGIRELQRSVRKRMDAGLTPEEMTEARAVDEAAQAAETILNELLA